MQRYKFSSNSSSMNLVDPMFCVNFSRSLPVCVCVYIISQVAAIDKCLPCVLRLLQLIFFSDVVLERKK